MRYLFLDDERIPLDVSWTALPLDIKWDATAWDIVRSYTQFIEYITYNGLPDFVSFDHDLADQHYKDFFRAKDDNQDLAYDMYEEKTGYDCVKWLVGYCIKHNLDFPVYAVHSMNPIGKDNIIGLVNSYNKHRKQNNESN